jgi:hypothetical protein
MSAKFAVGAHVLYFPDVTQDRQSGGLFEITRLLPLEQSGYSYRIKNAAGRERVAQEHQLENAA